MIQFLTAERFLMNDYMLELVALVADLIGYLEKAETNIADIAVEFLTLQINFDNMEAKHYICNKFSWMLLLGLYPNSTNSTSDILFMSLQCIFLQNIMILPQVRPSVMTTSSLRL